MLPLCCLAERSQCALKAVRFPFPQFRELGKNHRARICAATATISTTSGWTIQENSNPGNHLPTSTLGATCGITPADTWTTMKVAEQSATFASTTKRVPATVTACRLVLKTLVRVITASKPPLLQPLYQYRQWTVDSRQKDQNHRRGKGLISCGSSFWERLSAALRCMPQIQ